MTTLSIPLTPELAALVSEKMTTGKYDSTSEVVLEALRLLKAQTALPLSLDALRHEIQKGTDSLARGESRTFASGEELAAHIEAEGRKLLAAQQEQK